MKTRVISGVIITVIAYLCLHFGGYLLLAVLGVLSIIGLYELYRVFEINKNIGWVGYVTCAVYYLNLVFHFIPDIMLLIMALLIVCLVVYVFGYPKFHAKQVMALFFGFFYVAVMIACVYQTRMLPGGKYIVWLIVLCSWVCDTCAYFVGVKFGKHKMSPKLSPKKSVEGAIGGVVGGTVITILFCIVFKAYMGIETYQIFILAFIAACASLISMVGDLAASAIKRNYDIKDYGKLIPGHGGVLDRFDSVIITAPIIFYLTSYILNL